MHWGRWKCGTWYYGKGKCSTKLRGRKYMTWKFGTTLQGRKCEKGKCDTRSTYDHIKEAVYYTIIFYCWQVTVGDDVFRCLLSLLLLPVTDIEPGFQEGKAISTTWTASQTNLRINYLSYVERQYSCKHLWKKIYVHCMYFSCHFFNFYMPDIKYYVSILLREIFYDRTLSLQLQVTCTTAVIVCFYCLCQSRVSCAAFPTSRIVVPHFRGTQCHRGGKCWTWKWEKGRVW